MTLNGYILTIFNTFYIIFTKNLEFVLDKLHFCVTLITNTSKELFIFDWHNSFSLDSENKSKL